MGKQDQPMSTIGLQIERTLRAARNEARHPVSDTQRLQ
jgi:hypothetical protein